MTPLQSVERELLLHADALRELAMDLVGARAAEDLVQETAVRALRSPPREPQALFRWLATILRRLASKHRRGERRRQAREHAAARDEALPPADALLERRDMLRRVTDAVLALPEPYQATMIRRYFQERTPSEIAAHDVVPVATVKSRLQRGLSLLRAQLDRDGSDWRRALIALTGVAPWLAYGTGTLLMTTTTTKMLTATGALLAAALWFAFGSNPVSAPPHWHDPAVSPVAIADPDGRSPTDASDNSRQEVSIAAASVVDLSHPFEFELQCTVVDSSGLPVRGANLFAAPRAAALNLWPEVTDADGKVTLRWRGKQSLMTMAIGVRRDLLSQDLQEIAVQAGAPRQLSLLAEPSGDGAHPGVDSNGDGANECSQPNAAGNCRSCHEGPQQRSVFDGRLATRSHLHPEASFADLLLPKPPAAPLSQEILEWRKRVESLSNQTVAVRNEQKRRTSPQRQAPRLSGIVYGPEGKPANDVLVQWSNDNQVVRVRTDRTGQFWWYALPAGRYSVHVGGGNEGLATAIVDLSEADATRHEFLLDRGAVIRGRTIGADGAPLARWRVEYVGAAWSDACITHVDGNFVLPNVPPEQARLLLWSPSGLLPVAIEPMVLPDSADVVFDLRQRGPANGRLRLLVALPDAIDRSNAELRVWQQDGGRGASMTQQKDGSFGLAGLAAGFYRVEIGAEACGWRDLGPQWVDGKGLADLGRVELAAPGRVRITRGEDLADGPEFYLRRDDCDLLAEHVGGASNEEIVLPAGAWLCLWRTKDGALHSHTFALRCGEVVDVQVGGG